MNRAHARREIAHDEGFRGQRQQDARDARLDPTAVDGPGRRSAPRDPRPSKSCVRSFTTRSDSDRNIRTAPVSPTSARTSTAESRWSRRSTHARTTDSRPAPRITWPASPCRFHRQRPRDDQRGTGERRERRLLAEHEQLPADRESDLEIARGRRARRLLDREPERQEHLTDLRRHADRREQHPFPRASATATRSPPTESRAASRSAESTAR